jgi:hypothetical protein
MELHLIDLGDAMIVTKQWAPAFVVPDSTFGWSWPY